MRRVLLTLAVVFATLLSSSILAIAATGLRVTPVEYDPFKTRTVSAQWITHGGVPDADGADHALYLAKNAPTATWSAALAIVDGVEGLTLRSLGFDYRNDGWCGAGAPRFNVTTADDATYFIGCAYGTHSTLAPNWTRVRFGNADVYPQYASQPAWPGFGNVTLKSLLIVFDEGTDVGPGFAVLDNIAINGVLVGKPGNAGLSPWSLFGGAAESTADGMPAPSIALSSTSSTAYSGIAYTPMQALTFASISSLSASWMVQTGDCGGGSPRFQVGIDQNGDGARDGNVFIYVGPLPSFTGCASGWQTTGNLIGNTDLRFDLSQLGGVFYDSYANALVLVGSRSVTGIQLVVDGGWSADQVFLVDNVEVNGNVLQQAP